MGTPQEEAAGLAAVLNSKIDAILDDPSKQVRMESLALPSIDKHYASIATLLNNTVPFVLLRNNINQIVSGAASSISMDVIDRLQNCRLEAAEESSAAVLNDAAKVLKAITLAAASSPLVKFDAPARERGALADRIASTGVRNKNLAAF